MKKILQEPGGVTMVISPYNQPILLTAIPLITALLAGILEQLNIFINKNIKVQLLSTSLVNFQLKVEKFLKMLGKQ
jgi:hypothetical protein